ncbi:hypothetical protein [Thermodesulfobacterium hydrogeniphilum]|uniref:hypothetical protein n=1 Tax=Thermodesulfobacterium hydrogeniphilum TaxID=161156 RepID=UPI000571A709|nr:hypothetical protein [Thermodesulfobacterium hydrogeniphilum]
MIICQEEYRKAREFLIKNSTSLINIKLYFESIEKCLPQIITYPKSYLGSLFKEAINEIKNLDPEKVYLFVFEKLEHISKYFESRQTVEICSYLFRIRNFNNFLKFYEYQSNSLKEKQKEIFLKNFFVLKFYFFILNLLCEHVSRSFIRNQFKKLVKYSYSQGSFLENFFSKFLPISFIIKRWENTRDLFWKWKNNPYFSLFKKIEVFKSIELCGISIDRISTKDEELLVKMLIEFLKENSSKFTEEDKKEFREKIFKEPIEEVKKLYKKSYKNFWEDSEEANNLEQLAFLLNEVEYINKIVKNLISFEIPEKQWKKIKEGQLSRELCLEF